MTPELLPTTQHLRLTGRLVTDGLDLADGAVIIEDGRVVHAGPARSIPTPWQELPTPPRWRPGLTLLPGLVDIHCHGGAGGEFGAGVEGARAAAAHHLAHGTTSLVASIASRPAADLARAVDECAVLAAEGTVAGIHLEGPFLSLVRCGAQDPKALTDVDPDLVADLLDRARGAGARVLQMTHAPERDPAGTLPHLLGAGEAVAAIGHTDTDAAAVLAALARAAAAAPAGRRPVLTHLFNGMPPLHHRAPGPAGAGLMAAARGEAVVELIGDGVHLAPETVRMVFETVGRGSIALITDAMAACGMPDGRYELGGQDVEVADGVARLGSGGSIAGGTCTLLDVLRWTVGRAGVPLADAVVAATITPATTLGLPAGSLRPGAAADVLVVDEALRPWQVYRAGTEIGLALAGERR